MRDENRVSIFFPFVFNLLAQFFHFFHLGLGLSLGHHGIHIQQSNQRQEHGKDDDKQDQDK
ncbi:hypothetical protein EBT31_13850 [bacterium]|nr:hypothetical protein [bacterium]